MRGLRELDTLFEDMIEELTMTVFDYFKRSAQQPGSYEVEDKCDE